MNNLLLIFFALPIAVVIISIALQKILKNPFLVAGIIFAIALVETFIIGNLVYLVVTIALAIISFITAVITKIICRILRELDQRRTNVGKSSCVNLDKSDNNILTISNSETNTLNNELLGLDTNCSCRNDSNDVYSCRCYKRR